MFDSYKKKKLPFILVTFLFSISLFLASRGLIKYLSLWLIQLGYSPLIVPYIIGNPLYSPFHFEMFLSFFVLIITWLLSTRVAFYQEIKMRLIVVSVMVLGVFLQLLWHSGIPIVENFIPFIIENKNMLYLENYRLEEVVLSNIDNVMLLILSIPLLLIITMSMWLLRFCHSHWEDIIKRFKTWEYNIKIPRFVSIFMEDEAERVAASSIKDFFKSEKQDIIPLPDVEIGVNTKSGSMVVLKGKDRTLNNVIIGAIGTGKTSALILPIINQDLHHMTFMINNFKRFYNQKDYHTEEVKGSLLNGISVIEPSKDLCDKAFELVKAHGIPEEAVFYIDPTNPETPSINLFNQPVEKVAEMFSMVISGIGESQEYFFEQSQRTHLKSHIYLLMLHSPEKDVSFDDLIDMYNDAQLVGSMHAKLKEEIKKIEADMPENDGDIRHRDKINHLKIVKGIDEWFTESYVPEVERSKDGTSFVYVKDGPYRGQPKVHDTKAEHVVGLRNVLNDIASNILLRRVLFGKSTFNFDLHLEYGGILLVNTAKGELAQLSDVLGKFCLLSLQNAVFRRKPNVSSYHHIIVDEFPDYLAEDFKSFPAQSRKYKAIVTVVAQTVSQLSYKYGQEFKNTLMAALRNKFLYGDSTQQDAEMFSALFGEKIVFEESENDMEVSPLQESPMRRTGQMYTSKERAILTPNEVIYQEAFECAVKLVEDNKPLPVQQIKANFVPKEEFKSAKIKVENDAGDFWMNIRYEQLYANDSEVTNELLKDQSILDELPVAVMDRPLGEVKYEEKKFQEPQPQNESLFIDQALFNKNFNKHIKIAETPLYNIDVEKSVENQGQETDIISGPIEDESTKEEDSVAIQTDSTGSGPDEDQYEDNILEKEEGEKDYISFEDLELPKIVSKQVNTTTEEEEESPIYNDRSYGLKAKNDYSSQPYETSKQMDLKKRRRVSKVNADKNTILKALINDEDHM